jgi:hypothetical protein
MLARRHPSLDTAGNHIKAIASPSRRLALQARRSGLVAFDPPDSFSTASEFELSNKSDGGAPGKTYLQVLQPIFDFGANLRGLFLQAWLAVLASSLARFIVGTRNRR